MHGLHSSKNFLEFGLLCDRNPLKCTLYLKETFTKPINIVLFFSTNDQNVQMNSISDSIIIYLLI